MKLGNTANEDTGAAEPVVESPYLTVESLAAYLHHSPHTIRSWHKKGLLPQPYKPFGKLLWHRDEIDAWVKSRPERKPVSRTVALQSIRVPLPGESA